MCRVPGVEVSRWGEGVRVTKTTQHHAAIILWMEDGVSESRLYNTTNAKLNRVNELESAMCKIGCCPRSAGARIVQK